MVKSQGDRLQDVLEVLQLLQDPMKAQAEANRLIALKAQADKAAADSSSAILQQMAQLEASKEEARKLMVQHKISADSLSQMQADLDKRSLEHAHIEASLDKASKELDKASKELEAKRIELDQREAGLKASAAQLSVGISALGVSQAKLASDQAQVVAMQSELQAKMDKLKSIVS